MDKELLRQSCNIVERLCRSLGQDCTVVFNEYGVSIAPASWAGDSSGDTLFETLLDALESKD